MGEPPSSWPPNAMTYYLSGLLAGITRGRDQVEAEIAALHAVAYQTVQHHARQQPHAEHRAAVKARQIASCERQKREAGPWPDEVDP